VSTGVEPTEEDIRAVRQHCKLPLYLGSGITARNLPRYLGIADGFIVGSTFKRDGQWNKPVDPRRVEQFMEAHGLLDRQGVRV
jgi:predicted TIM-barrel enzyme